MITGAGRRLGRATALELARSGMNVLIHYRSSRQEADAVARLVRVMGRDADVLAADLADPVAVRGLAEAATRRTGGVHALVNNASNYIRTPWSQLDETAWDTALGVNLKAPYLLSLSLGRDMHARGAGAIVNLVDWCTERPPKDYLPYIVSKAGLVALTKALARELAPHVRVNAVAPGPVELPDGSSQEYAELVRQATPLGLGTAEAVARAVRFLVADASFSTGAVLHVDGGRGIT